MCINYMSNYTHSLFSAIWVIILIHTYFVFVCKKLHLIKNCLCCFLDMPLYSNNLSTKATISSLIMLEFFPACFSCSINFNLSHSSLGPPGKKFCSNPRSHDSLWFNYNNKWFTSVTFSSLLRDIKIHFFSKLINYLLIFWIRMANIAIIISHSL